jgi:hypothetical protein
MPNVLAADMVRESLRPFIAPTERPQGFSPDEAREFLENAEIPWTILEHLARRAKSLIDRGVERGELVVVVRDLLEVVEQCAKAFDDVQVKTRATSPGPEGQARVATLEGAISAATEIHQWLTGLLQWLETLPPPATQPSLPSAGGARGAAGYIGMDELKARLRSRGGA